MDAVLHRTGETLDHIDVLGWCADPSTGGMLAGCIVTTGDHAVWCSGVQRRTDVAAYFGEPGMLATGFAVRIASRDLASAWHRPVRVYGVNVAGQCHALEPEWCYNADTKTFEVIPA